MMQTSTTKIVLGRGELYFDRFLPGTTTGEGELYVGNTTAFSVARTVDEIKRFRSYGGQKIAISSLITEEQHTGGFVTDNIAMENVSLWFGGQAQADPQAPIGYYDESLLIRKGRSYQLGLSFLPIIGVTFVEHVTVRRQGEIVTEGSNYRLDKEAGRITILPDAADLFDGDTISVNFEWREDAVMARTAPAPVEVIGALRFVSTNPVGPRKDYIFPYVRLSATGEASLKGDEWQQLAFEFEVRRLNAQTEFMYVRERGKPLYTRDEKAIVAEGLSFSKFARLESKLDLIVNTIIPWRKL